MTLKIHQKKKKKAALKRWRGKHFFKKARLQGYPLSLPLEILSPYKSKGKK